MQGCGIQHRQIGIGLLDEHGNLGAAQDHAFGAPAAQFLDHREEVLAALVLENAEGQLLLDHPVDLVPLALLGHDDFNAMLIPQTALVEVLTHGERCAHQAHLMEPQPLDLIGSGIGNVDKGHMDALLQLGTGGVHGVGAEDDEVRAGFLQLLSHCGKLAAQDLHFSLAHVFQHLIEVHRIDDALHIVEAAQPLG